MTAEPTADPAEQPQVLAFDRLRIGWDRRVLQPRPWTAQQSHLAATLAEECPPGPILELFCGAGHIGLLAASLSGRDLVQVDSDPVAAAYARDNAAAAGVRSDVRQSPIESALADDEVFPLVIADPPWVPSAQVADFPDDPVVAIDGGPDGRDLIRECLDVALQHLEPAGRCVVQVGTAEQAADVCELVADHERVVSVHDCRPGGLLVALGPASSSEPASGSR